MKLRGAGRLILEARQLPVARDPTRISRRWATDRSYIRSDQEEVHALDGGWVVFGAERERIRYYDHNYVFSIRSNTLVKAKEGEPAPAAHDRARAGLFASAPCVYPSKRHSDSLYNWQRELRFHSVLSSRVERRPLLLSDPAGVPRVRGSVGQTRPAPGYKQNGRSMAPRSTSLRRLYGTLSASPGRSETIRSRPPPGSPRRALTLAPSSPRPARKSRFPTCSRPCWLTGSP